ncbi:acrB/AcrD/AcrF family protein, partial [Vibrio parahaemolyticus V-223/04]
PTSMNLIKQDVT